MSLELQVDYKYISMRTTGIRPKTKIYTVDSKSGDYVLGLIKWHPQWRQYCFFPTDNTVFSKGCLEDINNFITNLMTIHSIREVNHE